MRGNLAAGVTHSIFESVSYNTAVIAIAILKIILSTSVLVFTNVECNKRINDFLIYMLVHDIAYCVVLFMNLTIALKNQENQRNRRESIMEARQIHGLNQPREFGLLVEDNNYYIAGSEESEALQEKRNTITGFGILTNM